MKVLMRAALALLVFVSSTARADSWLPPSKQTYVSQDGSARLTVIPRDLKSSLAYFEDKVAGREPAGAAVGSKQRTATAIFERRGTSGRWEKVWTKALANEVAPVDVVVANNGLGFATFDNWHSMGYGPNAVVIYGRDGTLVRQLGLNDLFPDWFVAALPRSVSSINWRDTPRLSEDQSHLIIPVRQPAPFSLGGGPVVDLHIRLADGAPTNFQSSAWKTALNTAANSAVTMCAVERKDMQAWNSPIAAPAAWDEPEWHTYLREIYYRTAPIVDGDFPDAVGTTVLRPPSASDFQASVGWLKDALTEATTIPGFDVRAIGSPDYERLTQEIEAVMRGEKPNRLKGVKLIITLDAAHTGRVKAALLGSGADLVIVDPSTQFPQRPERLRKELSLVCEAPQESGTRASWLHALPFVLLGGGVFMLRKV